MVRSAHWVKDIVDGAARRVGGGGGDFVDLLILWHLIRALAEEKKKKRLAVTATVSNSIAGKFGGGRVSASTKLKPHRHSACFVAQRR